MKLNNTSFKKKMISVLVIIFVFVIVLVIYSVSSSKKTAGNVEIITTSVPSNVTIKVDNKKVSSSFSLPPGNYSITGEKTGFKKYQYSIKINENDKDKELYFVLEPESEEAKIWANKNQDKYLEIESKSGASSQASGAEIYDKNPIISLLPSVQSYYRIDYKIEDFNKDITLQITGDSLGRRVAIEKIRQWGYEPSDYKIEFRGFSNIFKQPEENDIGAL